jgi:ribosome-binding factor A
MNGTNRIDKVNSELQKEIADVISRKLKNPLITEIVSILDVVASKDLRHAKVYLSIFSMDNAKKERTFNAIVADSKRIRYELSKSMRMRTVPELHFVLDGSMDYGDKMDKLFKKIDEGEKTVDND